MISYVLSSLQFPVLATRATGYHTRY